MKLFLVVYELFLLFILFLMVANVYEYNFLYTSNSILYDS